MFLGLNGHRYKVTVVGDGMVGKTCFLITYKSGVFPDAYIPTVFDNYTCTIDDEDHEQYPITVWDTAGQEEFDKLRLLTYPLVSGFNSNVYYSTATSPQHRFVDRPLVLYCATPLTIATHTPTLAPSGFQRLDNICPKRLSFLLVIHLCIKECCSGYVY